MDNDSNKKGKFVSDRRRISLEDALHGTLIPWLGGRPERAKDIGKEDLVDLKIVLETTNDVNQFLGAF